jgi:hypothetical protein
VKIARALFIALGVTLVSCSDSSTEPTVGASGSLSFTYTGAGAANATQYSATGAIPQNFIINAGSSSWAAAGGDADGVIVLSAIPQGGNSWNLTQININRTTAGTGTIDLTCSTTTCTDMTVLFGANQNQTNYTFLCTIAQGAVEITAISSTNVTGTFSGTGSCHNGQTGTDTPFTVTNGAFDVGVTSLIQ